MEYTTPIFCTSKLNTGHTGCIRCRSLGVVVDKRGYGIPELCRRVLIFFHKTRSRLRKASCKNGFNSCSADLIVFTTTALFVLKKWLGLV
ncbi:uncharacterized protein PHALS_02201 [Plasmopara halstedii]|uniref:Uncharacterized protein n=1 Tax=Plasmopara halstedii TaxID=4781 RepID=A0A0P1A7Z2_PLAHL|nr:uncharacterized protein PHALS_02201 [Plasmopara halstedii]CEG36292.1 hypothetical protein PHALS_02201 [Plasmopara halstedii]|eukprot:XP_024572661.1 hypothetical protein PHALS_02201 [Plasmopara halstedii]